MVMIPKKCNMFSSKSLHYLDTIQSHDLLSDLLIDRAGLAAYFLRQLISKDF